MIFATSTCHSSIASLPFHTSHLPFFSLPVLSPVWRCPNAPWHHHGKWLGSTPDWRQRVESWGRPVNRLTTNRRESLARTGRLQFSWSAVYTVTIRVVTWRSVIESRDLKRDTNDIVLCGSHSKLCMSPCNVWFARNKKWHNSTKKKGPTLTLYCFGSSCPMQASEH